MLPLARCWLIVIAALVIAPPASAQGTGQPATPKAPASKVDPADLPVSLDRIQKALANTPRLRFDEQDKPVFRVEIFGEKPSIEDILGPEFWKGPVPYGAMTHQEFLSMVTPEEFKGYASYTNKEGAQLAATSFAFQWALQKAIQKYNETKDARAREAARREVLEALAALEEARAKAGLKR